MYSVCNNFEAIYNLKILNFQYIKYLNSHVPMNTPVITITCVHILHKKNKKH